MNQLTTIDHKGQRVLTTQQLAERYETEPAIISNNFKRNEFRYQEGIHFFRLQGEEKREFLNHHQIDDGLKNAQYVYLWTEKGCLLHAKSLGTDKAWEVYEMLVDTYFRVKENRFQVPQTYSEALRLAADALEQNEALKLANAQQNQIINELQPKATYYDLVLQNKSLLPITKIAKDYGMSGKAMNQLLHELGVQYKMGDTWLLYQDHAKQGYTQTKTHVIDAEKSATNTYWTQKGRLFIYDLLKNKRGILPLIEREAA